MPTNVKISGLPVVTSLNSSDVLPSVAGSSTSKITVQNLANSLTQVSSSISASFASTANTASFVTSSRVQGPFGVNSILSASYSLTASYALNAGVGGTIGGSGNTNRIAKFTAGTTIGDSRIFDDGTDIQITGSIVTVSGSSAALVVTGSIRATAGITGSLFGTASFVTLAQTASFVTLAQTASFVTSAQTASFLRNLNQDVIITGSLIVSGSPSPEIRVIGDMTVTGSVIISGSSALRIFNSASIVSGSLSVGNITPSSTVGRIDASNDIVAYSTSDARLKTEVSPIQDPISKVNMISGVNFTWIQNPEIHGNSGKDVGVIAQELEAVLPEVVTTRENGYKAVKYEKIVPLLIEAIKDLQKQIDELKAGK